MLPGGQSVFVESKATGKTWTTLQRHEGTKLVALGFRVELLNVLLPKTGALPDLGGVFGVPL